MASHDPSTYKFSTPTYILMYSTLLTAYYMSVLQMIVTTLELIIFLIVSWDTSMAQKSRFKMQTQGITTFRKTFPQLPGCLVENPTYVQTAHG